MVVHTRKLLLLLLLFGVVVVVVRSHRSLGKGRTRQQLDAVSSETEAAVTFFISKQNFFSDVCLVCVLSFVDVWFLLFVWLSHPLRIGETHVNNIFSLSFLVIQFFSCSLPRVWINERRKRLPIILARGWNSNKPLTSFDLDKIRSCLLWWCFMLFLVLMAHLLRSRSVEYYDNRNDFDTGVWLWYANSSRSRKCFLREAILFFFFWWNVWEWKREIAKKDLVVEMTFFSLSVCVPIVSNLQPSAKWNVALDRS